MNYTIVFKRKINKKAADPPKCPRQGRLICCSELARKILNSKGERISRQKKPPIIQRPLPFLLLRIILRIWLRLLSLSMRHASRSVFRNYRTEKSTPAERRIYVIIRIATSLIAKEPSQDEALPKFHFDHLCDRTCLL